jgi:undecaprenyl-diphosphatase
MPILHAIVLGIVQGLSEFLPISSSGHLRIVPWLFGWDDFAGQPGLKRAFDVALHVGTLVGACAYFRHDLVRLAHGGLSALRPSRLSASVRGTAVETGVDPVPGEEAPFGDEARLAWLLLATALPAAVAGLLLGDVLEDLASTEWLIGMLLIVFGLVLLAADRLGGERTADGFSLRDAAVMGTAQALALSPGVSRSGATITAARAMGFTRDAAARLSFLMSLPVIAGAILYEGVGVIGDDLPPDIVWPVLAGIAASAVTGWVAVWATLRLVQTRTFTPFVVYRTIVGVGVILLVVSGVR